MSRILSGMAEMNANFSGIGNLNNVIRGMNDRQSAMESRLTQQYGLQNDFNNDQAHFNNQARNFFSSGQSQSAAPPHSYYFGGSNSSAATSATNTYAPVIPIPPNTPNPFQFATREPAVELGQLQLGDEYENAELLIPGIRQPDYNSIPRYISLPEAPDANYNEPLQITNGDDEEEDAAALPIANSEAENIVEQFMPQQNILDASADGTVARISDMEQLKNDREARQQQKKTKDDGKIATQDEGEILQPNLARDIHNQKQNDLKKHDEIGQNAMVGYNDVNNILQDYDWFMQSMEEQKYTKTRHGQELQRTMKGEELRIYNKLMKVGTNTNYKGDATATHRTTAYKNIKAREDDINEFVKRNQPKQAQPENKQKDYVPLDERTMTMETLKESGGVAAPSANDLRFG